MIKVIRKRKNEGKGGAILDGLKYVSGDIVIIQDADLEYDPTDYGKLLARMSDAGADVVYGSRFSDGNNIGPSKNHYIL